MGPPEAEMKKRVAEELRDFPDFPKPGILFKDVMPVLKNAELMRDLCAFLAEKAAAFGKVDAVAGLEARGFLFGPQVAMLLGVPFVPIRKAGKLPGVVVEAEYEKEYGPDRVAVQEGAVAEGARVLIVDDLLATGGTLAAAVDVIRKAKGDVAGAVVLIELAELKGRAKIPGTACYSLLAF